MFCIACSAFWKKTDYFAMLTVKTPREHLLTAVLSGPQLKNSFTWNFQSVESWQCLWAWGSGHKANFWKCSLNADCWIPEYCQTCYIQFNIICKHFILGKEKYWFIFELTRCSHFSDQAHVFNGYRLCENAGSALVMLLFYTIVFKILSSTLQVAIPVGPATVNKLIRCDNLPEISKNSRLSIPPVCNVSFQCYNLLIVTQPYTHPAQLLCKTLHGSCSSKTLYGSAYRH